MQVYLPSQESTPPGGLVALVRTALGPDVVGGAASSSYVQISPCGMRTSSVIQLTGTAGYGTYAPSPADVAAGVQRALTKADGDKYRALLYIKDHAGAGFLDMANALGVSLSVAIDISDELVREGLVKRA